MDYLIVIIFSTLLPNGMKDMYVFERPSFETVEECINGANDPVLIKKMTAKLYMEYGRAKDIERVICSTEKKIVEVLEQSKGTDI
jgi:hypothetical protein